MLITALLDDVFQMNGRAPYLPFSPTNTRNAWTDSEPKGSASFPFPTLRMQVTFDKPRDANGNPVTLQEAQRRHCRLYRLLISHRRLIDIRRKVDS